MDDNEILLRAWEKILPRESCVLFATTNPEVALEYLEREPVDIIICDIVMPRLDGFDLVRQLKHMKHEYLPIIVLTTGYVYDFTKLQLNAGPQDIHVLLKPYNDIHQVGGFIHQLIMEAAPSWPSIPHNKIDGLDKSKIHLWNL